MSETATTENKTAIYLTDKEVELFLKFLKYQDIWQEVFAIRDGSVELHFDSNGELLKVGFSTYKKLSKSYPQFDLAK